MVAAAHAADVPHPHHVRQVRVLGLQRRLQLVRFIEVAGHVVAHPHIHRHRCLQPEVRVEACHRMHVAHVHAAPLGDQLNLLRRNVAMLVLHMTQVLKHTRRLGAGVGDGRQQLGVHKSGQLTYGWESLATLYMERRAPGLQIWFAIVAAAEYNSSQYHDSSSEGGVRVLLHRLGHARRCTLALAALAATLPAALPAAAQRLSHADGPLRVMLRSALSGEMHADIPAHDSAMGANTSAQAPAARSPATAASSPAASPASCRTSTAPGSPPTSTPRPTTRSPGRWASRSPPRSSSARRRRPRAAWSATPSAWSPPCAPATST